jgi:hypothetical protein
MIDDYDKTHNQTFDHVLHIYQNDNIETKVRLFFQENHIMTDSYISNEMIDCITHMRHAICIMDSKYITNLSSRFCHPMYSRNENEYVKPKWYLITVWRKNNNL